MASIGQDPNGAKRILIAGNDKRQTIRLGKASLKQAQEFRGNVEALVGQQITGGGVPDKVSEWLAALPANMHSKLVKAGLAKPRQAITAPATVPLRKLCDEFFASVAAKPQTKAAYKQGADSLLSHFGEFKPVMEIGTLDAEKWRQAQHESGLALASVGVAGRTGGRLYALSTVGSIAGTLVAALVLVQFIGTRATLYAIVATLVIAALAARGVRAVAAVEQQSSPALPPGEATAALHAAASVSLESTDSVGVLSLPLATAIVVVEGMSLMATEMSVARLVAPFFGASQAVWAVLIAIVMGCIAAGSALGGRAADRRPTIGALVLVLAAAGAAVALLPFAAAPVMRLSTGGIDNVAIGTVLGSFLATMLVLVVPIVLLGMVPAWVLRLSLPTVARSGRTAGRLYACSTAGALVGTWASALWLIPAIGTRRTLLVFALALAALACAVAVRTMRSSRLLIAPSAALLLGLALLAAPTGLVKSARSWPRAGRARESLPVHPGRARRAIGPAPAAAQRGLGRALDL